MRLVGLGEKVGNIPEREGGKRNDGEKVEGIDVGGKVALLWVGYWIFLVSSLC